MGMCSLSKEGPPLNGELENKGNWGRKHLELGMKFSGECNKTARQLGQQGPTESAALQEASRAGFLTWSQLKCRRIQGRCSESAEGRRNHLLERLFLEQFVGQCRTFSQRTLSHCIFFFPFSCFLPFSIPLFFLLFHEDILKHLGQAEYGLIIR